MDRSANGDNGIDMAASIAGVDGVGIHPPYYSLVNSTWRFESKIYTGFHVQQHQRVVSTSISITLHPLVTLSLIHI